MAATLSLVRWHDISGVIDTLNLYTGSGIGLITDGWSPEAGNENDDPLASTLTLHVTGSSHNNLAAVLQTIDDKIRQTAHWFDSDAERYTVMMRHKLTNETNTRQVAILNLRGRPNQNLFAAPTDPGNFVPSYTLGFTRMPAWEKTSLTTESGNSVNCMGGAFDIAAVAGTVPARVAQTQFEGDAGVAADLYEFWLGFRSDRFGARANLISNWDLTLGGNFNNTNPVGGQMVCDFAGETDPQWEERVKIEVRDVTANYADQRGEFQVLMRANVSNGTTICDVRLTYGNDPLNVDQTPIWHRNNRVRIDGSITTNHMLYDLGTVNIPSGRGFSDDADFLRLFTLRIRAARISGAGDLNMDRIVLIPRAEGMLHFKNAAVRLVGTDTRPAKVRMFPDQSYEGWQYDTSGGVELISSPLEVDPYRYTLPVNECRVVVAGQEADNHDTAHTVDVELKYFTRYHTMAGAT